MRALLNNTFFIDHDNAVGILNRCQAMSNNQRGTAFRKFRQ
jgi:hypothetical protein